MFRSLVLILTTTVLATPAAFTQEPSAEQPAPSNLVRSHSLDGPLGDNGLPTDWDGGFASPDEGYKFRVADTGRTGDKSLSIEGQGQFGVVSTNKIEIDPAMRYRARGWVKIEGDAHAAADVKFHYFGPDQQYLGQTRIPFVSPPAKEWTMLEVTDRAAEFPEAKWIQVAVALAGNGRAWYDDLEMTAHRREGLASDFDLSPELKILNRWAGNWKVDVEFGPAAWTGPGVVIKTETKTSKWILGNQFIEETRRDVEPDNRAGSGEHRAISGYDARKNKFLTWYFDSHGNTNTASGTWDAKTATMTWESDLDNGVKMRAVDRFIDADRYEYKVIVRDQNGELLLDGSASHRRVGK